MGRFRNEVELYYNKRLGFAWHVYLLVAIASFVAVVWLSFTEASKINDNKTKTEFSTLKHASHYFKALAYLTIVASLCTVVDFKLMYEKNGCRLTPITIATGTLATFLGIMLWSLNEKKNLEERTTRIFILQTVANSVQLAAIFNTPNFYFLESAEQNDLNALLF